MSTPQILVTNDDGITSKGIRLLTEVACQFGEVTIVAPDKPQSGMGHAITVADPLKLKCSTTLFTDLPVKAYTCSGTPADCVKMANDIIYKTNSPDLVLSGINHGSNSSISVLYSGTMSAAIEAAIENIPAIGFSLCEYGDDTEMSHCKEWMEKIIVQILENGTSAHTALNVNIPAFSKEPIKGIKIARQSTARWYEKYEKRTDPFGNDYYWIAGDFIKPNEGTDTDEWALDNNYVSVVPCQFDMTAHKKLAFFKEKWSI
ncbi:MAG: 5'/3'-nucleotidase SurE [Cyclobacteriaceae bacterium]